jgi:hypothetical protein
MLYTIGFPKQTGKVTKPHFHFCETTTEVLLIRLRLVFEIQVVTWISSYGGRILKNNCFCLAPLKSLS